MMQISMVITMRLGKEFQSEQQQMGYRWEIWVRGVWIWGGRGRSRAVPGVEIRKSGSAAYDNAQVDYSYCMEILNKEII